MASIPYEFNIHHHHAFRPEITPNTCLIPNPSINFELSIEIAFFSTSLGNIGVEQETIGFSVDVLKDEFLLHQILTPRFNSLGINTASARYQRFIRSIIVRGLGIPVQIFHGWNYRQVLSLQSEVYAIRDDTIPSGIGNYGMVPAEESLVKEVVKKVRVETRDEKEDCMICLDELKVGFAASRIPCSHTFSCWLHRQMAQTEPLLPDLPIRDSD